MLILSKGPSIGGENLPLARFASANLKEDEDFDDEIDFAEEIASRRVLFRLVLFKLPVLEKPQVPLILTRKQTP